MPKEPQSDVLFGMKSISSYLGRSESIVVKYARSYSDFPAKQTLGKGWVSSRIELDRWFRTLVTRQ